LARPFYGPRTALWEVVLDGRPVTIAYGERGHRGALAQGLEALEAGRSARVVRTEFCPACGTSSGVRDVVRRGRVYPVQVPCRAHQAATEVDEIEPSNSG
jgi:hypothetical protein